MTLTEKSLFKPVEEGIYTTLENTTGAPYDNKAKAYERMVQSVPYNKIMWGTTPSDYTQFARLVVQQSTGTLLDIGCGGLVQTAEVYATALTSVILLDNSLAMLRIGKQRILEQCGRMPDTIQFVQGDAFHLPFDDNALDAVCSFGILHLFDNKTAFIQEALRVLKPGQRFYFTTMTADRTIGRWYMKLLKHEFAAPLTSVQMLKLFEAARIKIESYKKGSMLFISGTKPYQ